MDSERWERLQELFHRAAACDPLQRTAFLRANCEDDAHLRSEVSAMLAADDQGASLLDRGLPEIAWQVMGDPTDSAPSREFGPYRLLKLLGEGGMGVVWLAERIDAGNHVAIKFLLHAGLSPARRERFTHEIRMLAKLRHPYIARLYDAGTLADGTPWFVMEYVEGVPLTDYCRQPGRSAEDLLRLFRLVCEAVQYAHGQEVIHRDLKPSNILVVADGTPRLLDFGIARELHQPEESVELTRPGLQFRSPPYAAPEWMESGVVGFFTDVYSLGVILYEMLTGRLPAARSPRWPGEREIPLSDSSPTRPSRAMGWSPSGSSKKSSGLKLSRSAWRDLDVFCLKAIDRDPRQRYSSVEALLRDVDHFLASEPLDARPDSLSYRAGKFVRRHRGPVLSVSATVVAIVVITMLFTLRLEKARNAALSEASRRDQIQQFMLNLLQGGDKEAGPANDLRVVTLIDRGVQGAKMLHEDSDAQADLYQTLGTMYQRLGKLDQARALLASSLELRTARSSRDPAALADNLVALGLLEADQGKAKEAEGPVRQALAILHNEDPKNLPLLGEAQAALGSVLVSAGEQDRSVEVLRQAIATMDATGVSASPDLSGAIRTLADAELYLGHYDEAVSLNQRALAMDRGLYGEVHPRIAEDLGNLAQIEHLRCYYPEAEQLERPALQIVQTWYGADHPETARKMITLSETLVQEGKYPEAEQLARRAQAILEKTFGNEHELVAYATNALASVELQEKKFAEAEEGDREVVSIYSAAYGDRDYRVAVGLGNLASVYCAEKRYPECERMLVNVVDRFTRALGARNINTGEAQVRLGRTLLHEKKYAEAEQHSRAGYEILAGQTSSQNDFVQGARHDLAIIYAVLHEPERAQSFGEAALSPPKSGVANPK
jgi:eukaryotic-like serine/threonine-protein kinase